MERTKIFFLKQKTIDISAHWPRFYIKLRHGPNGQEFFPEQIQSEYVRRPQMVVSYLSMMVEIAPCVRSWSRDKRSCADSPTVHY